MSESHGKLGCVEQACSTPSPDELNDPVVFLHGFGGAAAQWKSLQSEISTRCSTLAFDLPGHGGSLHYPDFGPPKIAARAVIRELQNRNLSKVHLVGHSMGGAIAGLISMFSPDSVASLTLLAPGGFGPQINIDLLKSWARASSVDDLRKVLPNFFAPDYHLSDAEIEFHVDIRKIPGTNEALEKIAAGMTRDGKQGELPLDQLLAGDLPVSVIWGERDEVLPVSQGKALQGKVDLHILPEVGHSPAEEAFTLVQKVIFSQLNN